MLADLMSLVIGQRPIPFLLDSSLGPLITGQLASFKVRAPRKRKEIAGKMEMIVSSIIS